MKGHIWHVGWTCQISACCCKLSSNITIQLIRLFDFITQLVKIAGSNDCAIENFHNQLKKLPKVPLANGDQIRLQLTLLQLKHKCVTD